MANDPILGNGVVRAVDSTGKVWNLQVDTSGNLLTATSGGGGGAVTIADGADVAQGTTTDATSANTVIGRLKNLLSRIPAALGATGGLVVEGVVGGVAQPISGTVTANPQPVTSGGLSVYRNLDLGTTGVNPKASAGQLYSYFITNQASATRYVKFYDKATAPASTDTPVWTLAIPAFAAANVSFTMGVVFASGIGLRASTAIADNDTGAPTTNDVVVNLGYK